jgi:hypothetical protein
MTSNKYAVNPIIASFVILPSIVAITFGVGIAAAMLGSEYESSCVSNKGEEPVCTTRYAFKGAGNIDIPMPSLQVIAGAIGTSFGIWAGLRNGNIPSAFKKHLKEEGETL